MAGARALWRATGMGDDDFGKPIIAIANSFTQFVPGHVHLKDLGQMVARELRSQAVLQKNSVPLPLMMELQWGTQECSIAYPLEN